MNNNNDNNGFYLIIVAVGNGSRCFACGSLQPKQYFMVDGMTPLEYVIQKFLSMNVFCKIIVVVHPDHRIYFSRIQQKLSEYDIVIFLENNGIYRSDNVLKGLNFLKQYSDCKYVMVHDAVRYLVTHDMIMRTYSPFLNSNSNLEIFASSMSGSMTSSLLYKKENDNNNNKNDNIFLTINRDNCIELQTPQMFKFSIVLEEVYRNKRNNENNYFDEFSIVLKQYPKNVVFIPSNGIKNCKITNNNDLDDFFLCIRYNNVI